MKLETIAIVSANAELLRFLELEFSLMGYDPEVFERAETLEDRFDCIVLDVDTVKDMRGVYNCPIINVSESANELVQMSGSYAISYPVSLGDIRKIVDEIRESSANTERAAVSDDITVYVTDVDSRTAVVENCHIKLTEHEMTVLCTLCEAKGKVVTRECLTKLLGAQSGNITDVYVHRLRKKLEGPLGRRLILSERGKGYKTLLKMKK